MNIKKLVSFLATFAMALVLVPTGLVHADHEHGGRDIAYNNGWAYTPETSASCDVSNMCQFASAAENVWRSAGAGFNDTNPTLQCPTDSNVYDGVILFCADDYSYTNFAAEGRAELYVNGYNGAITGAVIHVCNVCGLSDYDFQKVTNHELGHALGLDHTGDRDSIMYLSAQYSYAGADYINCHDMNAYQITVGIQPVC